jgi:Peptidase family S41/N-terminal domain of Peptidase_S41 in eukaryotic IRBP
MLCLRREAVARRFDCPRLMDAWSTILRLMVVRTSPPSLRFLAISLLVFAAAWEAETADSVIPGSRAEHLLREWLDAFNSGDRANIESFDRSHAPWATLAKAMELRSRTGGYDLLRIERSGNLWVVFRAKEKSSGQVIVGRLVVDSRNPAVISNLGLQAVSIGTEPGEVAIDGGERARVIETAAKAISDFYVFPDVAKSTSAGLRAGEKHGAYRDITDGEVLATRLTDDLRDASHDKHISVHFSSNVVPPDEAPRRADKAPGLRQHLTASNCGFVKTEHLSPNLGYLKLDEFGEASICAPTAIGAMNLLADSDALIIDLRENRGGAPDMVMLICSYLFDESTHLDDVFDRETKTTKQTWTSPYVSGKRLAEKPLYVLVSKQTFSAAEEFSYDLKSLKRATLIGEATGGGAHLVAPHRLGDHFFIEVPFGRFVNPITKTDWERTGVEPDVKVPAGDALSEALKRARGASQGKEQ